MLKQSHITCKLDPNKWKFSILSCKQVYVNNCRTKGANADESCRGGRGVYEPPILADIMCEQPPMQNTYFYLNCTFLKSSKREPSAQYQYFRSWCSLSGSLGTLKEVAQQAEEKRLPQKISFNCLETSPKLDKPTHFRKLQLETFLPKVFTFITEIKRDGFYSQCRVPFKTTSSHCCYIESAKFRIWNNSRIQLALATDINRQERACKQIRKSDESNKMT